MHSGMRRGQASGYGAPNAAGFGRRYALSQVLAGEARHERIPPTAAAMGREMPSKPWSTGRGTLLALVSAPTLVT
jgi:hypothetical protein